MITSVTYIAYIVISVLITIFVSRTLSKNGEIYLIDGFNGNIELARSVNHMLVVGFYLINIGFVLLALRYGARPIDFPGAMEYVSTKVGLAMLVLGAMHFTLMYVIAKYGRHAAGFIAEAEGDAAAAGEGVAEEVVA